MSSIHIQNPTGKRYLQRSKEAIAMFQKKFFSTNKQKTWNLFTIGYISYSITRSIIDFNHYQDARSLLEKDPHWKRSEIILTAANHVEYAKKGIVFTVSGPNMWMTQTSLDSAAASLERAGFAQASIEQVRLLNDVIENLPYKNAHKEAERKLDSISQVLTEKALEEPDAITRQLIASKNKGIILFFVDFFGRLGGYIMIIFLMGMTGRLPESLQKRFGVHT